MASILALPDTLLERVAHLCLRLDKPSIVAPVKDVDPRYTSLYGWARHDDRIITFLAFAGTCRRFRTAASSVLVHLKFTREIIYDRERGKPSPHLRLLYVAGPKLRTLTLDGISVCGEPGLVGTYDEFIQMARRFSNLTTIRFNKCTGVEALIIALAGESARISQEEAQDNGGRVLPGLEELTIEGSRKRAIVGSADELLQAIAGYTCYAPASDPFPTLHRLNLQAARYACWDTLKSLFRSSLGQRMTHFRLGSPVDLSLGDGTRVCQMLLENCRNLTSIQLYLWEAGDISPSLCRKLGRRLNSLTLSVCEWSDQDLKSVAAACPNLKKLSLSQCALLTPEGLVTALHPSGSHEEAHCRPVLEDVTLAGMFDLADRHLVELCSPPPLIAEEGPENMTVAGAHSTKQEPTLARIRKLTIVRCGSAQSISMKSLDAIFALCANTLEYLEVRPCGREFFPCGRAIAEKITNTIGDQFKTFFFSDDNGVLKIVFEKMPKELGGQLVMSECGI